MINKKNFLCPKYFSCNKFKETIDKYLPSSQIKNSFSFGEELNYARLVICINFKPLLLRRLEQVLQY